MSEAPEEYTVSSIYVSMMIDRLTGLGRTLERLSAETVRALEKAEKEPTGSSEYYSQIAQDLTHEVTWGLANAGLHYIAMNAAQADISQK